MNDYHSIMAMIACLLLLPAGCSKDEVIAPQDGDGPAPDPRINWKFTTDAGIFAGGSSPAIGADGTIYVGTSGGGATGDASATALYAISPTGAMKWKYAIGKDVFTPAVGEDGTIYVQDKNTALYAIHPDGTLRWKYSVTSSSEVGFVAPAIDIHGTIYIGADAIYAINPDGTQSWKYPVFGQGYLPIRSSPAISSDGTIYVGATIAAPGRARLLALNRDGTLKWECVLGEAGVFSSPAIGTDGTIYIGTDTEGGDRSFVSAIDPRGALKWRYTITGGRPVRSSPAIGPDGTIYVGTKASWTEKADLLALNPDGTLKWKYTVEQLTGTPDDIYTPPAIGADGLIYFGSENRFFYALNPDGSLAWKIEIGSNGSSPPITSDGTVYVTTFGDGTGALYALKSTSKGLANSPWPKFHHDNRNTGRINP